MTQNDAFARNDSNCWGELRENVDGMFLFLPNANAMIALGFRAGTYSDPLPRDAGMAGEARRCHGAMNYLSHIVCLISGYLQNRACSSVLRCGRRGEPCALISRSNSLLNVIDMPFLR